MTATSAATGVWALDPVASTATFTAHQLWLDIHGTIPFRSAQATFGPAGELLNAVAELDLTGLDTGNPRRDRDLAKPTLLDIRTHPTLTVEVGPGTPAGDGWVAAAKINARGTTSTAQLQITPTQPESDRRAVVEIRTTLDRTPLGLRAPRFAIGRWIHISVAATFTRH